MTADPGSTRSRSGGAEGWVVVANSAAGTAEVDAVGAVMCRLGTEGPVQLVWTDEPDELADAARAHPDASLAVFGGDGTFSAAARVLVGEGLADRPVGMIPGGTGNDFARAVGIPLDPTEAAAAMLGASPRRLSLLRVDGRVGINAFHVGVGAAAARRAHDLKARLGPTAYPVGALVAGIGASPWDLTVIGDGDEVFRGPSLMAAVALGRTIGGGTELAPTSTVDDESAHVTVMADVTPLRRVLLGAALLTDRNHDRESVVLERARRVHIRADRNIPLNLDGEDLGDRSEVTVEVEPEAWTVLLGD